jgi:hypothetical protein
MLRRMLGMAVVITAMLIVAGVRAEAQGLYHPDEPGSTLVFPKFVRGTVAAGVPATEIEISAHCPTDRLADNGGFCPIPAGATVRLAGHWVCPGQFSTQICKETDFTFTTTIEGTADFNPEGSPVNSNLATVRVPPAPCPEGYLVVQTVDASGQKISFNGLVGDAVVRWNGHAAGSYKAIAIQDGVQSVTGTVMSTIKYDTDSGTPPAADTPSTTSLTLLTMDTLFNKPNNAVFTDLNFYDANEFLVSESTNYVCWEEIPISSIDPGLVRENMTRKGFFYSLDANKVPEFGILDPTTGPVTQLGLIDTVECPGNATGTCAPLNVPVTSSNNPSITNHYMYRMSTAVQVHPPG